jgi:tetratricopeptide (TPR) repeat protein
MGPFRLSAALAVGLAIPALAQSDAARECLKKGKEALEAFQYRDAIRHLTDAVRLNPKDAEAYLLRGRAYDSEFEPEQAIPDFTEAIRLLPKSAEAHMYRGLAYYTTRQGEKAIDDFTEVIRLAPEEERSVYARALVMRGITRYDRGEYAKAVADCREAIEARPKDSEGYTQLAKMLATCPDARFRDGAEAERTATKACELMEWKYPSPVDALAAACAEAGRFDEAVKWQKRAIETYAALGLSKSAAEGRLREYEAHKPLRLRAAHQWVWDNPNMP